MLSLIPLREGVGKIPVFSQEEEDKMNELEAWRSTDGRWWTPDGKQMLTKGLTRDLMTQLHSQSHLGSAGPV